ncbi:SH3 domain-containing protein [Clostridium taeniosporum]|uniref:SH3 domain-containing protein n=1 Tax=Clostridium taeniosporum TaxID=394958 RepID=A0A1D7XNU3_9CLOT|nr:SH3 domain-containing protein [Clostridium taeniosporum]AOR24984.1 SH3 domain-containing protein [Clostridium taeniosporum]
MKSKKVLSLLLATCIVGTSIEVFSVAVNAKVRDSITIEESNTVTDENNEVSHRRVPRSVGSIVVTARSGANIRKGPGTNYKKIGAIAWGEDTPYAYEKKNGWYKIEWGDSYGWISASTCELQ